MTLGHVALDDVRADDLDDIHTGAEADPDSDDSDVAGDHPLPGDGPDAVDPSRTTDTRRNWARRAMARRPVIVVGLLLVASAGVAAGLYWQYRVDQQRNAGAETAVIGAASHVDHHVGAVAKVCPAAVEGDRGQRRRRSRRRLYRLPGHRQRRAPRGADDTGATG
jgi:hypothetical protein